MRTREGRHAGLIVGLNMGEIRSKLLHVHSCCSNRAAQLLGTEESCTVSFSLLQWFHSKSAEKVSLLLETPSSQRNPCRASGPPVNLPVCPLPGSGISLVCSARYWHCAGRSSSRRRRSLGGVPCARWDCYSRVRRREAAHKDSVGRCTGGSGRGLGTRGALMAPGSGGC